MTQTSMQKEKMVTIGEAARILGVSIDTIRRWDQSGKLHSERLNGKDRFFSLEELERIKFAKALSISEAAAQLKLSPATLRRLEKKRLINPKRTPSGERIYDREVIKKFLESEYFAGEEKIKEEISEPQEKYEVQPARSFPKEPAEPSEKIILYKNLKPHQRLPEILATVVVFLLLLTFGIRNVMVSTAKSLSPAEASTVLSATASSFSDATPSPSASPSAFPSPSASLSTSSAVLTVKINDGGTSVNIRQKPTTNSEKIGLAKDGDTFEFVAENEKWYEIKLATSSGFIYAAYAKIKEEGNE